MLIANKINFRILFLCILSYCNLIELVYWFKKISVGSLEIVFYDIETFNSKLFYTLFFFNLNRMFISIAGNFSWLESIVTCGRKIAKTNISILFLISGEKHSDFQPYLWCNCGTFWWPLPSWKSPLPYCWIYKVLKNGNGYYIFYQTFFFHLFK